MLLSFYSFLEFSSQSSIIVGSDKNIIQYHRRDGRKSNNIGDRREGRLWYLIRSGFGSKQVQKNKNDYRKVFYKKSYQNSMYLHKYHTINNIQHFCHNQKNKKTSNNLKKNLRWRKRSAIQPGENYSSSKYWSPTTPISLLLRKIYKIMIPLHKRWKKILSKNWNNGLLEKSLKEIL